MACRLGEGVPSESLLSASCILRRCEDGPLGSVGLLRLVTTFDRFLFDGPTGIGMEESV